MRSSTTSRPAQRLLRELSHIGLDRDHVVRPKPDRPDDKVGQVRLERPELRSPSVVGTGRPTSRLIRMGGRGSAGATAALSHHPSLVVRAGQDAAAPTRNHLGRSGPASSRLGGTCPLGEWMDVLNLADERVGNIGGLYALGVPVDDQDDPNYVDQPPKPSTANISESRAPNHRTGMPMAQRKVLTPNNFADLDTLERTLLAFGRRYEQIARPFEWKFTRKDLQKVLDRLDQRQPELQLAA